MRVIGKAAVVLLLLAVFVCSCGGNGKLKLISDGKPVVSVIYSADAGKCEIEAAGIVSDGFAEICGKPAEIKSEIFAGDADSPAIFIGVRSGDPKPDGSDGNDVSKHNTYSIKASGNRIQIIADCAYLYPEAAKRLLSEMTVTGSDASIGANFSYTSGEYPGIDVAGGKAPHYSVIYESGSEICRSEAMKIRAAIREATGVVLEVKSDGEASAGPEILLGNTNRPLSAGSRAYYLNAEISSDKDGNIAITGNVKHGASKFTEFVNTLGRKGDEPRLNIPDFLFGFYLPEKTGSAPEFEGGKKITLIESRSGSYFVIAEGAVKKEYEDYLDKLAASGFEKHLSEESAGNLFSVFSNGYDIVTASYVPSYGYVEIAADCNDNSALPENESEYEEVASPCLSQLFGGECSFVIRLLDGRFIVIDGGLNTPESRDSIYGRLKAQNVLNSDPVVAAWIISHPHSDHVGGFLGLAEKYSSEIKLERVIMNFPPYSVYSRNTEADTVTPSMTDNILKVENALKIYYPKTRVIVAHAGQVFRFGGAEIKILYTFENLCLRRMEDTNTSSLCFTAEIAGQKIMFLADCVDMSCGIIDRMYGSSLKSDIVQVAHHGYNGGNARMYANIAAETAIWTNSYETVYDERLWNNPRNHFDMRKVKENLMMNNDMDFMTANLPYRTGDLSAYDRTFDRP